MKAKMIEWTEEAVKYLLTWLTIGCKAFEICKGISR